MVAQAPDRRAGRLAGAAGVALLLVGLTWLLEPPSWRGPALALLLAGLAAGVAIALRLPASGRLRTPMERLNDAAFLVVIAAVALIVVRLAAPGPPPSPAWSAGPSSASPSALHPPPGAPEPHRVIPGPPNREGNPWKRVAGCPHPIAGAGALQDHHRDVAAGLALVALVGGPDRGHQGPQAGLLGLVGGAGPALKRSAPTWTRPRGARAG